MTIEQQYRHAQKKVRHDRLIEYGDGLMLYTRDYVLLIEYRPREIFERLAGQ